MEETWPKPRSYGAEEQEASTESHAIMFQWIMKEFSIVNSCE